ncbi:MAG TPA: acyl carrier protein [Streptosporangiaceae bacterium]|jgi:acyl carrier protein
MSSVEVQATATGRLVSFIKERFLPAEIAADFGPETPLLELGVLDSLKAARLLNFIRKDLGTTVPTSMIDTTNFKDVRSIIAMIAALNSPGQDG